METRVMKKMFTAGMFVTLLITVILHPATVFPQSTAIQPADKYANKLRIFEEFVRKEMGKNNLPGVIKKPWRLIRLSSTLERC
jgi:hypothetical protein